VVASIARRPAPALNPRAWIVVPFGNVMKAQDLDWLRDASVNLLSLDMSRWNDVSVVPDKRVGDLIRELSSKGSETLTLNDGMSVARRAGAGMLVMGDFLKQGKGARIIANVFDVRTGAKVRTVSQQASEPDSLLGAFGPLARGVLAVPPPSDAKLGDAGTLRLDAYQEYLLGAKAMHRFDLGESRKHLTRALSLDSAFALAHLELSFLLAWGDASGGLGGEARAHAMAAKRLGVNLPKRERMLIDARVASAGHDHSRSCEVARQLVALDSTDVQSLYLLGECSFHDGTVDPEPSDSTLGRFRNSWNVALRSFTKILELDPSFLGAFEHVLDILQANQRNGQRCPTVTSPTEECSLWSAIILRRGDSLLTIPTLSANKNKLFGAQMDSTRKERTLLANLARARVIAQQWYDSDTTSEGARFALGRVLLVSGDVAGADVYLRRLSARAAQDNYLALRARLEVAAKVGRGAEARAMFDSLVKAIPDIPSIAAVRGSTEIMFGRLGRFDRGHAAAGARLGPEAVAYQKQIGRALLGQPRETMPRDEGAFYTAMLRDSSCNAACRFSRIEPTHDRRLGPTPAQRTGLREELARICRHRLGGLWILRAGGRCVPCRTRLGLRPSDGALLRGHEHAVHGLRHDDEGRHPGQRRGVLPAHDADARRSCRAPRAWR
jgi:TolB-like protein